MFFLDQEKKPVGGKWTYDDLNRKKFPKNKNTPKIDYSNIKSPNYLYSKEYTSKYFSKNIGELSNTTDIPH